MNFDDIELGTVQNEVPEELAHDIFMTGLNELQANIRKKFRSKIPSPKFPDFNYIYFKPFKSLMVPHMVPDYIPMLYKFYSGYATVWNIIWLDTELFKRQITKSLEEFGLMFDSLDLYEIYSYFKNSKVKYRVPVTSDGGSVYQFRHNKSYISHMNCKVHLC